MLICGGVTSGVDVTPLRRSMPTAHEKGRLAACSPLTAAGKQAAAVTALLLSTAAFFPLSAQGPPTPAAQAPITLSIVTQTPSPQATVADRRIPIELVFQDPQGLVETPGVVMTLDAADVTSFLEITRGRVRYLPPSDLPAGQRRVQITLRGKDGQPLGSYEWVFMLKRFPWLEEAELQTDIAATYQVATNKFLGTDPRHLTTGNIRVGSRAAEEGWVFTLGGNLRYVDEYRPRGPTLQGDKVDVPDYLAMLERGRFQLQMGNVVINESRFAIPNLPTRGVQGKIPIAPLRSEVHGFVTRAQLDPVGNQNGIGFEHGENRIHGASLIVTPFDQPQMLRLHGAYIEGDKPGTQKRSIEGGQRGQHGAWGATSNLFEGRLQGETEYSWGRFDNSLGDFVGPKDDRAWRGQFQWADQPFSLAGDPVRLSLFSGYDLVGTSYRTVGNPGITADREGFNTTMAGAWRFVNLTVGGATFWDNIDLLKLIPRTSSKTFSSTVGLNPPDLPTLNLIYSRTDQISSHQPAAFGARRIDNDLHRGAVTAGYNRETWGVNLSGGIAVLDNKTSPRQIPDNRTWNVGLGGSWRPSPTFNLSPSFSFNEVTDKKRQVVNSAGTVVSRRITTDTTFLNLITNWVILPQELTLDLQESLGFSLSNDNPTENIISSGSVRLSWNVEKYLIDFGRQVLSVRSTYNYRDDQRTTKVLNWGFFVALDVFFPVKW